MIDIRKLKELVRLMVENDLTELDLRDQEETVTVKRGPQGVPMMMAPSMGMPMVGAVGGASAARHAESDAEGEPAAASAEEGLQAIESPMVGTFYASPNPDSPVFVKVGDSVGPDSVVCLVEAMKVFNEIKAEVAGTIERVLVKNGEAVEFGQKLFLVRPA
ncbi:MAG: acetyl-CoA carboxylase biotin carboxyl carrier protein [Phycisphaerales bacterium]|jgi:acetyl-CoA carboxylase biotin carboxyl carrier protein|nr:acetyl-CoA carboxylase biotin carboxyl carrier protein [Phycisphaerales bacterium]